MAVIKTSDADLTLFQPTDVYFYAVDNRPLRQLLKNDQALNQQLEDVLDKLRYRVDFVVESPSVENVVGGVFIVEKAGTIIQTVVTHGTPGSSGSFTVNVLKNGASIYATAPDKPVLAFNDSDGMVISTPPNIGTTALVALDKLTMNIEAVQAGTPRWLRVSVWIKPTIVAATAFSF